MMINKEETQLWLEYTAYVQVISLGTNLRPLILQGHCATHLLTLLFATL